MNIGRAFLATALRAVVAAIASAIAVVLGMFLGFVGGSGSSTLALAAFAVFFLAGWSLLPLVRESRALGVLAIAGWAHLGLLLAKYGASHVQGWMLGPWALASVGVLACLAFKPPTYMRWLVHSQGVEKANAENDNA